MSSQHYIGQLLHYSGLRDQLMNSSYLKSDDIKELATLKETLDNATASANHALVRLLQYQFTIFDWKLHQISEDTTIKQNASETFKRILALLTAKLCPEPPYQSFNQSLITTNSSQHVLSMICMSVSDIMWAHWHQMKIRKPYHISSSYFVFWWLQ